MNARLASAKNFWLFSKEDSNYLRSLERIDSKSISRLKTAAAAQGIYFDPGTIGESLLLLGAFKELGDSWPTSRTAADLFRQFSPTLDHYAFKESEKTWWIENTTETDFSNPFSNRDWFFMSTNANGEQYGFDLAGDALVDGLHLFADLNGNSTLPALTHKYRKSTAASKLLEALRDYEGIEESGPRGTADRVALPELSFLNHSALLVSDGRHSVAIDPYFFDDASALNSTTRYPYQLVERADCVVFSHHHWDHFHYTSLARIDRDKPILVPRNTRPTLMNPPMSAYLAALGFTNVRVCDPGDVIDVGEISLRFFPFFGESFGLDSRFDALTYHITVAERSLYGSVDACHDEGGNMDHVMREIARLGELDIFLFGSSNKVHNPGFAAACPRHFSNELLQRPELLRYHPNVDDIARWCEVLRPKLLIPYAEFIFTGCVADDLDFGDCGSSASFQAYWSAISRWSDGIAEVRRWKSELERLMTISNIPLQMLHPLQGIRFS